MIPDGFVRVSSRVRCPICGKADWCLIAKDGAKAICPRVFEGSESQAGEAGYVHVLAGHAPVPVKFQKPPCPPMPNEEAERLNNEFQRDITNEQIQDLAKQLGLSEAVLETSGIGWSEEHRSYSFPMKDGELNIIGIRLRRKADGFKWAVKGSRNGLFFPESFSLLDPPTRVLICEGPTDRAALDDMGFDAIARPFCRGGVEHLRQLFRKLKDTRRIVVGDNDGPGRDGVKALAEVLAPCKVIFPPSKFKDARQWLNAGGRRSDVEGFIDNAVVIQKGAA